jgi:hypothetical protein
MATNYRDLGEGGGPCEAVPAAFAYSGLNCCAIRTDRAGWDKKEISPSSGSDEVGMMMQRPSPTGENGIQLSHISPQHCFLMHRDSTECLIQARAVVQPHLPLRTRLEGGRIRSVYSELGIHKSHGSGLRATTIDTRAPYSAGQPVGDEHPLSMSVSPRDSGAGVFNPSTEHKDPVVHDGDEDPVVHNHDEAEDKSAPGFPGATKDVFMPRL